jgi:hypothetical protein
MPKYAVHPPRAHTSAYVSIRQHTSAYVSIRQHKSAYVSFLPGRCRRVCRAHAPRARAGTRPMHTSACVSIRQHTSAYVSIRQHTPRAQEPVRALVVQYLSLVVKYLSQPSSRISEEYAAHTPCAHTSAYVSIRQHTSAYVKRMPRTRPARIRQHTSAYASIRQHT